MIDFQQVTHVERLVSFWLCGAAPLGSLFLKLMGRRLHLLSSDAQQHNQRWPGPLFKALSIS
jgi:hypothetical protein